MPITDAHDRQKPPKVKPTKPPYPKKPAVTKAKTKAKPVTPTKVPSSAQGRGGSTWQAEQQTKAEVKRKRRAAAVKAQKERAERKAKQKRSTTAQKIARAPIKSSGVGLLTHFPFIDKKDVEELEDAVLNMPGGVYALGKALTLDVKDALSSNDPRKLLENPKRTTPLVKEMAKATYRDLRHPLRNPLMTALSGSAVLSAGAGTVARGAAASSAAKAASAAGRSATKAAAGAALKRPVPGPRTHQFEGQSIPGRYSTSAAARGVQKAADKARERKGAPLLAKRPEPGAQPSTISARKAARLLAEEKRTTDALKRGYALKALANAPRHTKAKGLLARITPYKDISTPQDMAIRVAAEGRPLDDVIEWHRTMARHVEIKRKNLRNRGVPGGKGTSTQMALRLERENRDLLRKASILEESRKYLDVDAEGAPIISARYPDLQRKHDIARTASLTREKRAGAAGLLALERAEYRKHAPGRMFEKVVSGGRAIEVSRPRTLEEAKAALDKSVKETSTRLDKMVKIELARNPEKYYDAAAASRLKPKKGSREVPYWQIERHKHGGGIDIQRTGEKAIPVEPKTQATRARSQTGRELAEREIIRKLRASKHPLAQEFVAKLDAEYALERMIQEHEAPGWMREEGALPDLGTVKEFKGFDEVEPWIGGKFRVPDTLASKPPPLGGRSWRGGVPRKPGTLTHSYTGAKRRSGEYTTQTMRAVAEDALDFENYMAVQRYAERVYPMGHKTRPPEPVGPLARYRPQYVPVRTRPLKKTEQKALQRELADKEIENLSPDEATRIEQRVREWENNYFPRNDDVIAEVDGVPIKTSQVQPGTSIPGVVWVDRKLIDSQRGKLVGGIPVYDVTAEAVKGVMLYGKGGYALPNIGGNISLNIFQQGVLAPANWTRAVKAPRDIAFYMDEAMGEGFARSLAGGPMHSPVSRVVRTAGNFWNLFVDKPFRRAALYHELRRMGIKSDAQIRNFFEKGHPRDAEILQRARDAIIDYERLSPAEQAFVRRAIFIYPWIKGSTWYTAQFLRDHPVLAAVFTKLGQEGEEIADRELGDRPAWAEGLFRVGGSDELPLGINPNAISPFSTAPQVVAAARGLTGGVEQSQAAFEMANPVLQSAVEALSQRELFTGRTLDKGYAGNFFSQIGKGFPQYQLYKRVSEADEPETQEKTYPYTKGQALGQFMVGSGFPRNVNRDRLNEQAVQARTPAEKAKRKVDKERDEMTSLIQETAPEFLKNGKLPAGVRQAFAKRQAVETVRARARAEGDGDEYHRLALAGELDILARWGVMSKAEVARAKKRAAGASVDDVKDARAYLVDHYFEDAYNGPLRDARKWLEERKEREK